MISIQDLLSTETAEEIFDYALSVAESAGLAVTSWQTGEPARVMLRFASDILGRLESVVSALVRAQFLEYADEASRAWLKQRALDVYGVTVPEATYATGTLTLVNDSGGRYEFKAYELTFSSSITGETFRNTTDGVLEPLSTLESVGFVANSAGSVGSVGVDEVDQVVTSIGAGSVTISDSTAAVGIDEPSIAAIVELCRDSLGKSSNGAPLSSYEAVAVDQDLTGPTGITKARSFGDNATGDVTLYLAGPEGAVTAGDVAAAEAACIEHAEPQCVTLTVASASELSVALTYTASMLSITGVTAVAAAAKIEEELAAFQREFPIGGYNGGLEVDLIKAVIQRAYPGHLFAVSVTLPAADVVVANSEVVTWGTITGTVNFYG